MSDSPGQSLLPPCWKATLWSPRVRVAAAVLAVWFLAAAVAAVLGGPGSAAFWPLGATIRGAYSAAVITTGVVIIAGPLGWGLGMLAGAGPRVVDLALARVVELSSLWPTVVLLAVVRVCQPGLTLGSFVLVLGILRGVRIARLVRGEALRARVAPHSLAARALGTPFVRLLTWHVAPFTVAPLMIGVALTVANVVGLEAALSFVGLGMPPGVPSWGSQLHAGAGTTAIVAPLLAVVMVTGAAYVIADAMDRALLPSRGAGLT